MSKQHFMDANELWKQFQITGKLFGGSWISIRWSTTTCFPFSCPTFPLPMLHTSSRRGLGITSIPQITWLTASPTNLNAHGQSVPILSFWRFRDSSRSVRRVSLIRRLTRAEIPTGNSTEQKNHLLTTRSCIITCECFVCGQLSSHVHNTATTCCMATTADFNFSMRRNDVL